MSSGMITCGVTRGACGAAMLHAARRTCSSAKLSHQALQFTGVPPCLSTRSNFDARVPPGHQDRRLERGRLPQIWEEFQQGEVCLAIWRDADHVQRVAVAEVGPRAVAHDEEPAADALGGVDTRARP